MTIGTLPTVLVYRITMSIGYSIAMSISWFVYP